MDYQTSLLEDWIERFYLQIGIRQPEHLEYEEIARKLQMKVRYRSASSRLYKEFIVIDSRMTPQEQWQDFAHEICHKLRHAGNHLVMPGMYIEFQEFQANHFSYHFCVPTFMLRKIQLKYSRKETIQVIAETFGVTFEFADKRLQLFENRLLVQQIQVK